MTTFRIRRNYRDLSMGDEFRYRGQKYRVSRNDREARRLVAFPVGNHDAAFNPKQGDPCVFEYDPRPRKTP